MNSMQIRKEHAHEYKARMIYPLLLYAGFSVLTVVRIATKPAVNAKTSMINQEPSFQTKAITELC